MTRRAGRRWSRWCQRTRGWSRSAGWTGTPRGWSCSPMTATSPTALPIRATASRSGTLLRSSLARERGEAPPAGGRARRRSGPGRTCTGGGRLRPAPDGRGGHGRGAQARGSPPAGSGRCSRAAPGTHRHLAAAADRPRPRGVPPAASRGGPRPLSGGRPLTLACCGDKSLSRQISLSTCARSEEVQWSRTSEPRVSEMATTSRWPRRLAIVGTGLLGASVGLAAREAGVPEVVGVDADRRELRDAFRMEALTERGRSVEDAADGADLVVAATPVRALAEVLARAHAANPSAILTDVGSTKSHLLAELASLSTNLGRVIPGHPMAGSEQRGALAARADLFHGAAWVLTPAAHVDHTALRRMTRFVRGLGGRPLILDPELHDQVVA